MEQAWHQKIELSGIGKRGIQSTAKALSEEPLAENRLANLDLVKNLILIFFATFRNTEEFVESLIYKHK